MVNAKNPVPNATQRAARVASPGSSRVDNNNKSAAKVTSPQKTAKHAPPVPASAPSKMVSKDLTTPKTTKCINKREIG